MSTHRYFDRICVIFTALAVVISVLLMNAQPLGISARAAVMGYESRLFDASRVHTIDIVMDDWDSFIDSAQSEEYSECAVVIDGEAYKNVGIRGKGNTSLSSVASMNSERYSFKVEFDKYDSNKTYYGLDKLCLNNIIQDNTYMKDYLTYRMMNGFGVNAPLCSYAYITVNGKDWGLYLAVEGVEEGFLERNYGGSYGELYKPDSMSFGGGRGNGRNFDFDDFKDSFVEFAEGASEKQGAPDIPDFSEMPDFLQSTDKSDFSGRDGFGGGMGSDDVKLKYTDDNPDSYSNIFSSAKTDVSDEDKARLISSLKKLSEYTDIEQVVDIDEVMRYFVVHNFVCNGDSYTGSMIHNYYLYEKNGRLSMIPWDYNLAYGTFQGGNAQSEVNSAIDLNLSDRPMVNWIFESEEYTELYHRYFAEFLDSVDIAGIIGEAYDLISPYVEKDPTKFCTYDEYEKGVETLRAFCELRSQSVRGQLDGTIPSTDDGQSADSSALIDASSITLSDMGTMNNGGRGDKMQNGAEFTRNSENSAAMQISAALQESEQPPEPPQGEMPQNGDMQPPEMPRGENNAEKNAPSELPQESAANDGAQNVNKRHDMPQKEDSRDFGGEAPAEGGSEVIILAVSTAVLLVGGLVFAFAYRR